MEKIKILFMQSQSVVYADSMIHATLMRFLDREKIEVHVACTCAMNGPKSDLMKLLETIPDLSVRPTFFGPSVRNESRLIFNMKLLTGSIRLPFSMLGLATYIKRHGIQIIHCTEKPRDAFYGFLLARLTGAKCLIHLHVKVENWISPLTRWVMKRTDALIGVSSFVAQSSVALGFPAERTQFILNGMDLENWRVYEDGAEIRREFNVDPHIPVLAAIGRLVYYKGQAELIQAMAKVRERGLDFRLLILGEGSMDPEGYPARIKLLVKTLGLDQQVILTGYRKDVKRILAASDIFVLPSFEEPFGMVFLEAMAMRKPVVALDNGGSREIIEHRKSGLLSLPKDIDQLADNIVTLIQNPSLREQMGACGRKRVEEYFTARRMACDFEKFYQGMLKEDND